MRWAPNPNLLNDIVKLLTQANSTSSEVQRSLAEAVGRLDFLIDAPCYYCYILTQCTDESTDVRQCAGLLLKTSIARLVLSVHAGSQQQASPEQLVLDYIQTHMTDALLDPSPEIRVTAGNIITTLIARRGVEKLPTLLPFLLSLLDHENSEIVTAAFDTFIKIIEDEIDRNTSMARTGPEDPSLHGQQSPQSAQGIRPHSSFYQFCEEHLLSKLFDIVRSPHYTLQRRCKALVCLNHFQRGFLFSNNEIFAKYFPLYWETLGILANEKAEEARILVLTGIMFVSISSPQVLLNQLQKLLTFIYDCLNPLTQPYEVRLQCLELLAMNFRNKQSNSIIGGSLDISLPLLVENTRYSEWDYMQMDQNQFADDNALVPDAAVDIAPEFSSNRRYQNHHSVSPDSNLDEGEDSDNQISDLSTWGSGWTVRKVAAMILDACSMVFGGAILPHILPVIEKKLQSEDWEIKESAVLTLGAISRGCIEGLNPFLPKILDMLVQLCNSNRPILRTISLWTISRFSIWICPQYSVLSLICEVILSHVLDTNKRVQEAACSAFAGLEEDAGSLLVPHLPMIIEVFSTALKTFQTKNKFVLLDAIGTLADNLGPEIDIPQFHSDILVPIVTKWSVTEKNEALLTLYFECINCIIGALKNKISPYTTALVKHCIGNISSIISTAEVGCANQTNTEPYIAERADREVLECSFDMLSSLCDADPEQLRSLFSSTNFVLELVRCCELPTNVLGPTAKQGCFALIGDLAQHIPDLISVHTNMVVPEILTHISDKNLSLSHNASWALGQIALHAANHNELTPFADNACERLAALISSPVSCETLVRNSCVTLGRLAIVCPIQVNKEMNSLFGYWCMVMTGAPNYDGKSIAIRGLCNVINYNQNLAVEHMRVLLELVASLYATPSLGQNGQQGKEQIAEVSSETHQMLCNILRWLKENHESSWKSNINEIKASCQSIISNLI